MISNLPKKEEQYWNRQIARYQRRQRRSAQWKLIKYLSPPVLFLIAAAAFLMTCGRNPQPAAKPALNIDSTILQQHDSAVRKDGGE
jgi:hypothetical protein